MRPGGKRFFMVLVLVLVLINEPLLAGKRQSRQSKSSGKHSSSQRVEKAPTPRKVSKPKNTSSKSSKVARPARAKNSPASRAVSKSNNSRALKMSVRTAASRTKSVQRSPQSRMTVSKQSVRSKPPRSLAAPKRSVSPIRSKKSASINSSVRRLPVAKSVKRELSTNNGSIKRKVTVRKPSVGPARKTTIVNKPKPSTVKSTELIGTPVVKKSRLSPKEVSKVPAINRKRTVNSIKIDKIASEVTARRPAEKSKPTIRAVERTEKTRNQLTRKSRIVSRTPEAGTTRQRTTRITKVDKAGAGSTRQVGLAGWTESSLNKKIRRNRTRPILTSFQYSRPAHETSQHTRKDISQRRPIRRNHLPVIQEHLRQRRGKRIHSNVMFHERKHVVKDYRRHEHIYRDYHGRLCRRSSWPRHRFFVYYDHCPQLTFRYVYPYYHRKYIFVSLGGYWPGYYRPIRYYWYGYHPYNWYGYYPVPREVQGDTYNYYTYNYYSDEALVTGQAADGIQPVDHETFADIREKLAQQESEGPAAETEADRFFDEAVKAFEEGDYQATIEKFAQAMELAPDDRILPFAYSQALFANGQYTEAAAALRDALAYVTPEEEGIFYPRGLYSDEETLIKQIELLVEVAQLHPFEADFQLLLGYQLLGVGELETAVEPLTQAKFDSENRDSAAVLLELLEKIKTAEQTQDNSK